MILDFLKSSYTKLKKALSKTQSALSHQLKALFAKPLDEHTLEELERVLYEADLGVKMSTELTQKIREFHIQNPQLKPDDLLKELQRDLIQSLEENKALSPSKDVLPQVILIVGVNGNGKTTSVAKLAKLFHAQGKKVLLAAADTFRAAAVDQLELWAKKIGVDIVKGAPKSDPASVAFDAITAAKAREMDILIIDTAGRLHTKTNLMQELEKIKRSCHKVLPGSPHEILLVLDATTGQNAIDQAKTFHQHTPISGLVLTKLDGTAKGGIVLGIQKQLGIPVQYIGFGESVDDFETFNAQTFVHALFEN
ncbi:MAG: signal recognition particle-docking protein FtsY [Chlamydiales bacterium 38-26]|nr:signal recognition particle-docking protein FtsY [Chlamydiales bacterium]OJV10917.1 MAG: signal recognition particle-docking protein FtsY [Chlamydiales bacterium 38-26]